MKKNIKKILPLIIGAFFLTATANAIRLTVINKTNITLVAFVKSNHSNSHCAELIKPEEQASFSFVFNLYLDTYKEDPEVLYIYDDMSKIKTFEIRGSQYIQLEPKNYLEKIDFVENNIEKYFFDITIQYDEQNNIICILKDKN